MKLTIGIPCYNQQSYLADAIESALLQGDVEVIVCDDGSTDNSLEVAKRFPVKVIHQVNKGLASARNTLIMNMTGDYFLPLDADDILLDNCVPKIKEVIEKTGADIVAPSFKEFGISNREVILGDPTLEDFKTANRIGYFSAIKKEALLEVGGYSPRMTWGAEDYHLWINLLSIGKKLVTIKEPLVLYRTKKESMWTETQKHQEDYMKQISKDFYEN